MAKSHCLKVGALEYTDRLLHNMPLSFHTREFRVHNFTPNKPPTNLVVSKWKPWLLHGGRRRVMRKTDVRRSCTVGAKARAVLPRKSSDCFSNFSFSTEYVFRVCLAGGGHSIQPVARIAKTTITTRTDAFGPWNRVPGRRRKLFYYSLTWYNASWKKNMNAWCVWTSFCRQDGRFEIFHGKGGGGGGGVHPLKNVAVVTLSFLSES